MLKRFTPQLAMLLIICILAAYGYVRTEIIATNADVEHIKTVIIDAGHGGLANTTH